jgi:CYTH domain-containing protein
MKGKGPDWISKASGKIAIGISVAVDAYSMFSAYQEHNEMVEKLSPFIPITKIRYKIKFGKDVIELDEFDTGECYAEIEFNSEQEALEFTDPPAWFGKEVTGDNTHSNFSIYTKMQQKV